MADVLVVVAPGAEEIETMAVADVLVRAGQQVTLASTAAELVVIGSRGLPLAAHCRLDEALGRAFSVVYLPGGMGSATTCRDDPRIQALMARQLAGQRTLAVICASVISLLPQGLARRSQVTSFPGVRAQVEPHVRLWQDSAVVEDGDLVTSQGPGTAIALGLVLARRLTSPAVAATVAAAMLVGMPA
jgi:4-methyl-5(b-hydroxyethyl)-thiazole monophosphate biosynthesis